jgi:hypothetical protein
LSYVRAADCVLQVLAAEHPTEEDKLITVTIKSSVAGISETKSSLPFEHSSLSITYLLFSASLPYDASFRHPLQSLAPGDCSDRAQEDPHQWLIRERAHSGHGYPGYLWGCQELRSQLHSVIDARQDDLWICLPSLVLRARSYLTNFRVST